MGWRKHTTSASMPQSPEQLCLIERIERALLLLAYFIELDGDVHLPLYEKFESELADLKAAADIKARASERLAAYRRAGERKAIVTHSAFGAGFGEGPNAGSPV